MLQDPNMLRIIFEACANDSPTVLSRLRSVCKMWRDVVAAEPDLWFKGTIARKCAGGHGPMDCDSWRKCECKTCNTYGDPEIMCTLPQTMATDMLCTIKPPTRAAAASAITLLQSTCRMSEATIDALLDVYVDKQVPDEMDFHEDGCSQNEIPGVFVSENEESYAPSTRETSWMRLHHIKLSTIIINLCICVLLLMHLH